MNALEIENSYRGRGQTVCAWLTAASLAVGLAVVSVPATYAQDATPAAPAAPAAAPATATPPATDTTAAAPAAGTDANAATGMSAPTQQEEVENPYDLKHFWEKADAVQTTVLIILLLMSMGTWFILLTRLWDQRKLRTYAKTARSKFWTAGSLKEGMSKLEKESAYRSMVEDGLKASEHHEGKMTDRIDLNEWVTMSLQRSYESIASEMQMGLAFLASVGSTAPFIGLFGTVWGIYHALIAIALAGQPSIDKVAGPVGEALIMTALGLAVAVPAVLGYNWLVRRNKVALEDVRNFSGDIHAVLVSGTRVAS